MEAARAVVFVTGCSTGIGRACAVRFAERGYPVAATARRVETIRDLEGDSQKRGLRLRVTSCDVTSEESMRAAVEFACSVFGDVLILVNNAGYGLGGPIEAVSMAEARRQLEVNTLGPARLAQLVAPGMRKARWGRIINVSSVAGKMVIPLGGWYSASKFALEALSDSLRLELEPFGVHTVSIVPGPVRTEFRRNMTVASIANDLPDLYREYIARREQPARERFEVSPEAVADVILRAASCRRPKPRYLITLPATIALRMRPLFTDRAWDRIVKRVYGLSGLRPRDGEIVS